tara:strand:+ start:1328 stop:2506 length:1179 start_codon:yes stop_codon:yes gene_type:complete
MAFLDNSGDIILDAVLTDTGRLRLAQGDGSFKISKFALGDDEINYGLYNKDHASGSAYFDLEVLQTPVLEAFTNNTSNLKTKLVSIPRTNLLYMPILKLNKNNITPSEHAAAQNHRATKTFSRNGAQPLTGTSGGTFTYTGGTSKVDEKFYVATDQFTFDRLSKFELGTGTGVNDVAASGKDTYQKPYGIIQGYQAADAAGGIIRIDHGLDTSEISTGVGIDADMNETAFIVETDYRLGRLKQPNAASVQGVNFIDDDNIATYYVGSGPFINPHGAPSSTNNTDGNATGDSDTTNIADLSNISPQVFDGPRGNTFQFRIEASMELQQSVYMFNQIGQSQDADGAGNLAGLTTHATSPVAGKKIYYIDSTVRVVGANTGYRIDIPVRYIKIAN